MSTQFQIDSTNFTLSITNTDVNNNSIHPTLRFTFMLQALGDYYAQHPRFQVRVLSQAKFYPIGFLTFSTTSLYVSEQGSGFEAYLQLTHSAIKQIEILRQNQDLQLKFQGSFIIQERLTDQPHKFTERNISLDLRIPKSDWVERWLPQLNYKDVSLLEIPKLTFQDSTNIIENLNSAWKAKQMGQYNTVLNHARLVIEELREIVKKQGYVNEEKETRDKTDWKDLFESDSIGEIFGKIDQQVYRFASRGAHRGRAINLQDADYVLLITHAATNLVLHELEKEKD